MLGAGFLTPLVGGWVEDLSFGFSVGSGDARRALVLVRGQKARAQQASPTALGLLLSHCRAGAESSQKGSDFDRFVLLPRVIDAND